MNEMINSTKQKNMYFGTRLLDLRNANKLTQKDLARALGTISSGLVSLWENGIVYPTYEHREDLLKYFGKDADLFIKPETQTVMPPVATVTPKEGEKKSMDEITIMTKEQWIEQRHRAIAAYLVNVLARGIALPIAIVEEYNETVSK